MRQKSPAPAPLRQKSLAPAPLRQKKSRLPVQPFDFDFSTVNFGSSRVEVNSHNMTIVIVIQHFPDIFEHFTPNRYNRVDWSHVSADAKLAMFYAQTDDALPRAPRGMASYVLCGLFDRLIFLNKVSADGNIVLEVMVVPVKTFLARCATYG
jgi:hypothetical protein